MAAGAAAAATGASMHANGRRTIDIAVAIVIKQYVLRTTQRPRYRYLSPVAQLSRMDRLASRTGQCRCIDCSAIDRWKVWMPSSSSSLVSSP